jgi:hypothetical protein
VNDLGEHLKTIKLVAVVLTLICVIYAGYQFYEHRNFAETVVIGEGVTEVKKLSDYYEPLKDTINDCNIYIFDGKRPGGTLMVLGGSHPEEPAANLTAQIMVENAEVEAGRLIVAIRANRSASTVTRPGEGYPSYYHIETPWGKKKLRMGDRASNPLDSWPDPEVYIHYPSRQQLAYMDIRNFNRTWPGRENGTITEQTNYAFMELIKAEDVDVFIDYHEAELEYSVISTIVSHQKGVDIAGMASMILTAFEFPIGMEYSPKELHGLSHREVGDHSNAVSFLFETPEPFIDRVRGITDEALLLTGKDEFVMTAGKHGLLYEKIDETGWPIEKRVGRHLSTTIEIASSWSDLYTDQAIVLRNVPGYSDLLANGVGYYFQDPVTALSSRVFYE